MGVGSPQTRVSPSLHKEKPDDSLKYIVWRVTAQVVEQREKQGRVRRENLQDTEEQFSGA